jgi:hypothetical protein
VASTGIVSVPIARTINRAKVENSGRRGNTANHAYLAIPGSRARCASPGQ